MKRYDLRHLHDDFYDRMAELIDQGLKTGEVGIFLFEVGDFSHIQKSADFINSLGHDLMNSLKFNEVDWTIVVKKVDEETRRARAEKIEKARIEAEKRAAEAASEAEEKAERESPAAAANIKSVPATEAKEVVTVKSKTEVEEKSKAKAEIKTEAKTEKSKVKAEIKTEAKTEKSKSEKTSKTKAKTEKSKAPKKREPSKTQESEGDDLTRIKGIGKVYTQKLNSEGIYTFEDVANMNEEQIQMMEEKYSFKGDFRESVADAKKLLKAEAK